MGPDRFLERRGIADDERPLDLALAGTVRNARGFLHLAESEALRRFQIQGRGTRVLRMTAETDESEHLLGVPRARLQ